MCGQRPHVQRAQRVGSDDQRAGCPIPGTPGAPSQGWLSREKQSDHLNLAMDDEEGATLQHGSTGAQTSDEPNGAAEARFHGVLSRGGLPSNSGYRESVTAQSVRKVEPASADVEADGGEEPNPGAGRGKGLCCGARVPPPGSC